MQISEKVKIYLRRATIGFAISFVCICSVLLMKSYIPQPWLQLAGIPPAAAALIAALYSAGFTFAAALDFSALVAIRSYCKRHSLVLISTEATSKKYKAVYIDPQGQRHNSEWISSKVGFKSKK